MKPRFIRALVVPAIGVSMLTAGCASEFTRSDRSPVALVIQQLEAATGNEPDVLSGTLMSDVLFEDSIINDVGRVTMRLVLKDPGQPGVTNVPSALNIVQMTRYRVVYRRADGRNVPGVDVPQPFDGGLTFSVPQEGIGQGTFELVRHVAKAEPPLSTLVASNVVITTIAEITFFGHDMAGNDVSATGSILVDFANFADATD